MNNVLLKRIKALFLVAMAIAVALNLILTPVYHDGSPDYPVWEIMNWFMAAAVLVALIANIMRKRSLNKETTGALDYLRASITYYGAIALTMLFFWEWFWVLNPDSESWRGHYLPRHLLPPRRHAFHHRCPRHRLPSLERWWRIGAKRPARFCIQAPLRGTCHKRDLQTRSRLELGTSKMRGSRDF